MSPSGRAANFGCTLPSGRLFEGQQSRLKCGCSQIACNTEIVTGALIEIPVLTDGVITPGVSQGTFPVTKWLLQATRACREPVVVEA